MFVPATYHEILSLPACAPIADRMKYFMGHEHCNKVVEKDVGFMVIKLIENYSSTFVLSSVVRSVFKSFLICV